MGHSDSGDQFTRMDDPTMHHCCVFADDIPSHSNGQETTGSTAQSRLDACRSRDVNETVSNKPTGLHGHGNSSSTRPAARDIQHAE